MNTNITALITTVTSHLTAVASQLTLRGFSADTAKTGVYPATAVGSAALVLDLSNGDVNAALRLRSARDDTLGKRRRDLATAEESLKKARLAVSEAEQDAETAKGVQHAALEKQAVAIQDFKDAEAAALAPAGTQG